MGNSKHPVLRAVVINGGQGAAAQGEFPISVEEMEVIQLWRKVTPDDREDTKAFLEIMLRDAIKEQKSKQPTLSLVRGGV